MSDRYAPYDSNNSNNNNSYGNNNNSMTPGNNYNNNSSNSYSDARPPGGGGGIGNGPRYAVENSNQNGTRGDYINQNNYQNSDRGPPRGGGGGRRRRSDTRRGGRGGGYGSGGDRRSASPEQYRNSGGNYDGGRDGGRDDNRRRGGPPDRDRRRSPPPRSGGGGGGGGGGPSRSRPGPREEETTEQILDRTKKERPCRTLFVRNLKYPYNVEIPSEEVREKFERMGEVKTFFDLIPDRGMVFVTYYDIRAAMLAKESLQGIEISGRAMDVHYSLPRDSDLKKRCDVGRSQGTLSLTVPNSTTSIKDEEIQARFGIYGDIKTILPDIKQPSDRLIEFYDCRGCQKAFDELNGKEMGGGTMNLAYEWDTLPPVISNPTVHIDAPVKKVFGSGSNSQRTEQRERLPSAPPVPSLNDRLSDALRVQQMLSSLGGGSIAPPPPVANNPYAYPQQALLQQQQPNYNQFPQQLQQQQAPYGLPISQNYGQPPPSSHSDQYTPNHAFQPSPHNPYAAMTSQNQPQQVYNYGNSSTASQFGTPPLPLAASITPSAGAPLINLPAPLLALLSNRSPPITSSTLSTHLPLGSSSLSSNQYPTSIPLQSNQSGENYYTQQELISGTVGSTTGPLSVVAPANQVQALLALLAQQQGMQK